MSLSLQEQLKKSGLIDEKKAKQLTRAKHKQEKIARKGKTPGVDLRKAELEQIKSEKAAKDRQLNQQKNAKAEQKAARAQIRQLIESNSIAKDGEQKFSFSDAGKIKHIWVSQTQIEQLSHGTIAIVNQPASQGKQHLLVPSAIAEKIAQRDEAIVVFKAEQTSVNEEDDPYADFQIPDDLTW
ncbi:MAG: DUF2058 domain-containing protein [Pseudohongiella sp.]|jgi:uncharacterized protein|nr:DUF2058 domain-containing protein [Pseudohongiella sp.]